MDNQFLVNPLLLAQKMRKKCELHQNVVISKSVYLQNSAVNRPLFLKQFKHRFHLKVL